MSSRSSRWGSARSVCRLTTGCSGWGYLSSLVSWCNAAHVYVLLDMHIVPYGFAVDQQSLVGLESIWKAIAQKYSTQAYLGSYDLMNEPGWQG